MSRGPTHNRRRSTAADHRESARLCDVVHRLDGAGTLGGHAPTVVANLAGCSVDLASRFLSRSTRLSPAYAAALRLGLGDKAGAP